MPHLMFVSSLPSFILSLVMMVLLISLVSSLIGLLVATFSSLSLLMSKRYSFSYPYYQSIDNLLLFVNLFNSLFLFITKKVFYQLDLSLTRPALNPEAHNLYVNDRPEFLTRVEECVRKSTENAYNNPEGSSIHFSPYTKEMDSMRDSILKGKDKSDSTLLSWVSKSVSSIISFKY